MKAAIIRKWGPPTVFELAVLPEPDIKPDQIKIRVFASGINPVDWKHRQGNHRFLLGAPFPVVLGYDVCGEVVESGKDCKIFRKGDLVFGDLDNRYGGGLAEFCVGHEHCFAFKPENVPVEQAASVSLSALTALQALCQKAHISKGMTVLVNGASGGVGHLAIQIAKIYHARVIAVAGNKSGDFVSSFQPDRIIDYTKENVLNIQEKVDIFFDVTGNYSFLKVLKILNHRGVYITNLPRPKVYFHKLFQIFTRGKKVKTLLRKHSFWDMQLIEGWLTEGKLKVSIDKTFRLDEIQQAHEYAELGHSKGKNVILIAQ
jgi:NADPH:quinone reductase-like Zn-dependent oxidoreductase